MAPGELRHLRLPPRARAARRCAVRARGAAPRGSRLRAAILAGRYAPTLADARQLYPGRKINTLFAPGSKIPVFVPERFADPDLEAEAVQVIQNAYHLAKVTGRRSHLEAALDDPAVRQVSRIPGNRASAVFERALEAFPHMPRIDDPDSAARDAPLDDFTSAQIGEAVAQALKIDGGLSDSGSAAAQVLPKRGASGDSDEHADVPLAQRATGFAKPAEPIGARWVVRKEFPHRVPEVLRTGYQTSGEGLPSKVALQQLRGPYLPASTNLPDGAPEIRGTTLWINLNGSKVPVEVITNPEIIADMVARGEKPERIAQYQSAQARGEGEVLLRGKVDPGAITDSKPMTLRGGAPAVLVRTTQGLTVLAILGTTARMGTSLGESVGSGSAAPIVAQGIREAGGWGGAIAGARAAGVLGAAIGSAKPGVGTVVGGLAGALVGGYYGYKGADRIADKLHPDQP